MKTNHSPKSARFAAIFLTASAGLCLTSALSLAQLPPSPNPSSLTTTERGNLGERGTTGGICSCPMVSLDCNCADTSRAVTGGTSGNGVGTQQPGTVGGFGTTPGSNANTLGTGLGTRPDITNPNARSGTSPFPDSGLNRSRESGSAQGNVAAPGGIGNTGAGGTP